MAEAQNKVIYISIQALYREIATDGKTMDWHAVVTFRNRNDPNTTLPDFVYLRTALISAFISNRII